VSAPTNKQKKIPVHESNAFRQLLTLLNDDLENVNTRFCGLSGMKTKRDTTEAFVQPPQNHKRKRNKSDENVQ
jgi:hypothetical protein